MAGRGLVTGKYAYKKAGTENLNRMFVINAVYYLVMPADFLISVQLPVDMGKPLDAFYA